MDFYYKTEDLLTANSRNNATGNWVDTARARSANFTVRGTGIANTVAFKLFKPDPFGVTARGVEFFSMGLFNGYATSGITQYLPIDKIRAEISGIGGGAPGTGWAWASLTQQN